MVPRFLATVSILLSLSTTVASKFTNLPDVPQGVFNVSTRLEIKSTKDAVWSALTNFPAYADWNPFVRAAIAVSPLNVTLPQQYPIEGNRLFLRVQIPPLPLPVDACTPDNVLNTQLSYENVTHVQPELGRLAWEYLATPGQLLASERWQGVTNLGNGKTLYESREVFSGALAYVLEGTLGESLQEGFDSQGQGLRLLLER